MNVLMVAEKPSLAQSIAQILSDGKATHRKGISPICAVHEYDSKLFGKPAKFKVTSVTGHVFSIDFTPKFNNWDTCEPIELFEGETIKQEANPKSRIMKHLSNEAQGMDYLVLWLDCDREGENICFEVIQCAQHRMKSKSKDRILRARFSSITPQDIKRAMNELVSPNELESKAVDVRQELDLKIGCAFTRFQTRFFQGKYANLDSNVVSYGPCQTPTLALCVKRHDEITSFVPKSFYTIDASVRINGSLYYLPSSRGRLYEKKKAIDVKEGLLSNKTLYVTSIDSEKKSASRPHALNTVELLKSASAGLGIGPQATMHLAERLYIQGYISYPRTETSKYPPNFNLQTLVQEHTLHPIWGSYAKDLLSTGFKTPEGGFDAGDHPPITPMMSVQEGELTGDSWRLYDFITRHFLASLMPNQQYLKTKIVFSTKNGSETFTLQGESLLKPGFTAVMHWKARLEENIPADIKQGNEYEFVDIRLKEGLTSPPTHLTESDLIGLMEKLGIGTDASMAVHINNICERRYVQIQGNARMLVPTNLGIVLIHGLNAMDPDLALPSLRSEMEKKIVLIATGKEHYEQVLKDVLAQFKMKFKNFTEKIERMDQLFEASFSPVSSSGKPFSKCGKCRRHYIGLRPPRLHCRTCCETYVLPSQGTIKLFKELKCPIDGFELILFSTGSKGKGFSVCPYCYSYPPFDNIKPGMGCNQCPQSKCPYSMTTNAITTCPEDGCSGSLVLDSTSAPRWKMGCNECNLVSCFNDMVNDIKLHDSLCQDCFSKTMTIHFQKRQEKEDLSGCVVCDDELDELLETKMVRLYNRRRGGGRRGGRGRGRRGRGRGGRGRGGNSHSNSKPRGVSIGDYF